MERFEINKDLKLESFSDFINMTKEKISNITNSIRDNIKKYEESIENTNTELSEAKASREKCENEIAKMEGKIDTIKEAIDNVESTYKKIVEAYSSTSKGETKELYSEIIDGAKANCESEVEKNRNDIARLNSDIEAIKNNIQEFNRLIESLEKDLETYKQELAKYVNAKEYVEKTSDNVIYELSNINDNKTVKNDTKKTVNVDINNSSSQKLSDENKITGKLAHEIEEDVISKPEEKITGKMAHEVEETQYENIDLERIYDLTGYKNEKTILEPSIDTPVELNIKEEKNSTNEETKDVEPSPLYTNNLENLFVSPSEDIAPEPVKEDYNDTDMFEWEKLLNSADSIFDIKNQNEEPQKVKESKKEENPNETVNQLLMPYGTTFERLQSLVDNNITYKDGSKKEFVMTSDDVVKAINAIDGNDLKTMKTIGPEITLIRIIKKMKEGK